MAPLLRQHAVMLKNRLFAGLMRCQCTKAGACQNSMTTGRYKPMPTHSAVMKPSALTISSLGRPPPKYTRANWPSSNKAEMPMTLSTAPAYMTPSQSMSRLLSRPCRNALMSTAGMGKRP